MSVNLAEIQQKVNRLLYNMSEQNKKAYTTFFDPTPQTVELPQLDENGNLITVELPNRALIKQQMWDDFGAAIGQMSKTLYVDAVNGDDSNPGTSDAPFKTIKKAVGSVPVGGFGHITLMSDYNLTGVATEEEVIIQSKTIFIECTDKKIVADWFLDANNCSHLNLRFVTENAHLIFYIYSNSTSSSIEILPDNTAGTQIDWHSVFIGSYSRQGTNNISVITQGLVQTNVIVNSGKFIGLKRWDISGSCVNINFGEVGSARFSFTVDSTLIDVGGITAQLRLPTGSNLVDSQGNTLTWNDVISGVVKDANGNPRNIISNVIF